MQTKHMALIAIVVVICVAGVAYFALSGDDGGDEYVSDNTEGRLTVFGNANNDDYINEKDVQAIRDMIAGKIDKTNYADANRDGKVDEDDVKFVQDIIKKKADHVYVEQYYNKQVEVKECPYPLTKVCVVGYETMTVMKSIGAVDKIVCISGAKNESFDPIFYSDIYDLPRIGPDVWNVSIEQLPNYDIDAILAMDGKSYIPNWEQIEKSGKQVIRIQAANGLSSLNGIVTLGFLCDCVDRANKEMEFFDGILDHIEETVGGIKDSDRKTALFVTMSNYVEGPVEASEYSGTLEIAGAKCLADKDTWGEKARKQFFIGDEWLLKEKYQADFIVHSRGLGLGEVNLQENWDKYSKYFTEMDAYKEGNYFILNSTLTPVLRIAFMATQFYPDLFGEDYAVKQVQKYYDDFITNVEDFDAKTGATWIVTSDMVKA